MFRESTMVPFLLLLLLHKMLAEQVCLFTSKGNITIATTKANISDEQSTNVKCWMNGTSCLFLCTYNNTETFIGNVCLEATVEDLKSSVLYRIDRHTNCTLYPCYNTIILKLICSLDNENSDQKEMMSLFYIRDSCPHLFRNFDIKTAFLNTERQIIHNIMNKSRLENGGSKYYNLKALSLNVVNISDADLNSYGKNSRIPVEAPQLLPQNMSFVPNITLPVSALQTIPAEERIIGLVSYRRHSLFQFEQENISSMVIRIEVLKERPLRNLTPSIEMIFQIFPYIEVDNGSMLQCHYLDEDDWLWKTDGCVTHNSSNRNNVTQTDIICYCDHATPFAVLLISQPIEGFHWEILSYISYIGCSISAVFTAVSLVIYAFSGKHELDYSTSIHASLSGALFLLNLTFLLTEWGATVEPDWVCVFIAALMQYSLLCCFTWMAIEALHLYLLLIKVFNTYYKHYLVKLSLAGWGVPAVIVAITVGVKDIKNFYGVTQITMADTNQTNAFCWITDDTFFYSMNLAYFTLIFIFNFGILMAVASSICRMKQVSKGMLKTGARATGKTWRDPGRFSESCRSGLTVLGLTFLMGTTWGLAFLGSGYVNYPILYLFCILNSMQGFFIFLWICLSAKKQRRKYKEDRMGSSPGKTLETKSN